MKAKNTKKVAAKKPAKKAPVTKKTVTKKVAPAKKPVAKPVKKAAANKKVIVKAMKAAAKPSKPVKKVVKAAPKKAPVKKVAKPVAKPVRQTLPDLDFKPSFLSDLTKEIKRPAVAQPVPPPTFVDPIVAPGSSAGRPSVVPSNTVQTRQTSIADLTPTIQVRVDPFAGCKPVQPL